MDDKQATVIKCHYIETNPDYVEESLEDFSEDIPLIISTIENSNNGGVLGTSIAEAFNAFAQSTLLKHSHEDSLRYLILGKEFGIANFEYASSPGKKFTAYINGKAVELTGQRKANYVDSNVWMDVFFSAVMLRDHEAITSLARVDETLFSTANLISDSFDLALVRALQGIFDPKADIAALLEKALLCDDIDDERLPYAHHILSPLLPLIRCIFTANAEAEFNQELREAVEMHKAYWSKDKRKTSGWVSFPLTALAVIAKDAKGYKMNFETDYIPAWIVNREF